MWSSERRVAPEKRLTKASMLYVEGVLYPIVQLTRVPAILIVVKLLCFLLFPLGFDRVCRRSNASIRLCALALTIRMRFVGSTTYRSQSRSSLPDRYCNVVFSGTDRSERDLVKQF